MTHVLCPAWSVPRRRDGAEVIGEALALAAGGHGHRRIARLLERPPGTVRGWLRAARARSESLRACANRWVYALDPEMGPVTPAGSALGDAVEALMLALGLASVGLLWIMVGATEQPSAASCGTPAGVLTAGNPGIGYTQLPGKQDVEIKAAGNNPGVGPAGASALAAACSSVSPGSYVNPFRNSTSIAGNRIDMGVDYDGTGPIEALGDAQVTFAGTGIGGNWTCSNSTNGGVVYQLLDGAYKGKYVYIAEDITPTQAATNSLATHRPVPAGTPIAQFTGSAPCIEMGWSASPTSMYPLAETLPGFAGDQSPQALAAGSSMNRLVVAVHGPAGHQEGAGASVTPAPMPTGYP